MLTECLEYVGSCVSLREDKRPYDGIDFSSYECLDLTISTLNFWISLFMYFSQAESSGA